MKIRYQAFIAIFLFSLVGGICWSAYHYHEKYKAEKNRADSAELRADSASAIIERTLTTVDIINTVIGITHNAKLQIALESQRTENDIKVAVTGDECAGRVIPAAADIRLREYARRLRTSSSAAATGESNSRDTTAADTNTANMGQ